MKPNPRNEFFTDSTKPQNETQTKVEELLLDLTDNLVKVLQTHLAPNRPFYSQRSNRLIEQIKEKIVVNAHERNNPVAWEHAIKTIYRMTERQELLNVMKYRECKQEWQNQLMDTRTLTDIIRSVITNNVAKLLEGDNMKVIEKLAPDEKETPNLLDNYLGR